MLIGPPGVGKSRAVAELSCKNQPQQPYTGPHKEALEQLGMITPPVDEWVYRPTLGVEVHPIVLDTSKGKVQFNLWDLAGNPKFAGLDMAGYSIGAEYVVILAPNGDEAKPYIEQSHPFQYTIIHDRDELEKALIGFVE